MEGLIKMRCRDTASESPHSITTCLGAESHEAPSKWITQNCHDRNQGCVPSPAESSSCSAGKFSDHKASVKLLASRATGRLGVVLRHSHLGNKSRGALAPLPALSESASCSIRSQNFSPGPAALLPSVPALKPGSLIPVGTAVSLGKMAFRICHQVLLSSHNEATWNSCQCRAAATMTLCS